jgi:ATP-dependent DNA helicase PIF1
MYSFETNLFEITHTTEYILIYSNVEIKCDGIYKYSNYNHSLNIEKKTNNYILYKITDKKQNKYLINIKVEEPDLKNNSVVISLVDENLNSIKNIIYEFYYFDRLSKYKYKIINDNNHDNYSVKKILKEIQSQPEPEQQPQSQPEPEQQPQPEPEPEPQQQQSQPFGGIQVIFCGDFYQLPPVGNCGDPDSLLFCFESELWDQTFDSQYILDKSYRQTDETYITILNQIREGNLHKYYYNILKQRVNVDYPHNLPIKPVILYPTKRNVDAINYSEMEKIQENEVLFTYKIDLHLPSLEEHIPVDMDIETTSNFEKVEKEYNDKDLFIQKVNYLEKHHILSKLNANIKKGEPKYPSVKELKQSVTYLEKNSYFSTIKKFKVGSQVMCTANLDIEKGIYNGSVGYITEIKDTLIKVKFNNGLEEWIGYHNCEVENLPQVSFQQIPLILAWAITIHKSQGATLDCAEIDVGRSVFADGQTYVALSRVRSLEGLYLKSLDKSRITVNKKVVKFYEQFYE